MQPEMLVSRSYLFDHRRFQMPKELNEKLNTPVVDREWVDGQWHPEDMLTVQITDVDGELLGLISVDEPLNGLLARPCPCPGDRVLRRPVRRGRRPRPTLRAGTGRGAVRPFDGARQPARP